MYKDADKNKVCSGLKLKWKGIFDFDDLYQKMKFWLDFYGFGDENSSFKEEKYVQRLKGDSKQIEIRWKGEKIINDYFSYVITITFFALGLKDIKVEEDGKQIGKNTGEIEMRFSAHLVTNRQGKWKKDGLMKKIYESYIIKDRIEQNTIDLYEMTYNFRDEIKAMLDLHRFQ